MSIANTYQQLLTEEYLKERLSRGETISADDILDLIEEEFSNIDFSTSQFTATPYYTTRATSSSAELTRNTFSLIRQDIRVLYKELLNLSLTNQRTFERWDLEAKNIEKRLIDLEDTIENLLDARYWILDGRYRTYCSQACHQRPPHTKAMKREGRTTHASDLFFHRESGIRYRVPGLK